MAVATHWIKVDPSQYDEIVQGESSMKLDVYLSPYDVPEAVRGLYDTAAKRFVVEFKYIGEEQLREQSFDPNITVRVGRHSRRIYRIAINVDAMGVDQVAVKVYKAIDSLAADPTRATGVSKNYEVAKEVLHDTEKQVFRELATVH